MTSRYTQNKSILDMKKQKMYHDSEYLSPDRLRQLCTIPHLLTSHAFGVKDPCDKLYTLGNYFPH